MEELELLKSMVTPLVSWYDRCGRVLPWRENRDPYRVWVSEIMLQQTRVETVIPYYLRFLQRLPDIPALAAIEEDQLLKLWEGLGYYSRVRSMQKAAKIAVEKYGGRLPGSVDALLALPGIGEYTAGAIGSIAFGLPVPAVDGNVLRVVSRIMDSHEDVADAGVKAKISGLVAGVIPLERPGDFNQALMDLGATVCLPGGAPKCLLCPLNGLCRGYAAGTAGELPVKAPKAPRKVEERTVFVLTCEGRLALRRREPGGLLGGLWELPGVTGTLTEQEAEGTLAGWGCEVKDLTPLPGAKHIFTHVEWHMSAFAAEVKETASVFTWATAEELEREYMLPSAFGKFKKEIITRLEHIHEI